MIFIYFFKNFIYNYSYFNKRGIYYREKISLKLHDCHYDFAFKDNDDHLNIKYKGQQIAKCTFGDSNEINNAISSLEKNNKISLDISFQKGMKDGNTYVYTNYKEGSATVYCYLIYMNQAKTSFLFEKNDPVALKTMFDQIDIIKKY